MSVTLEEEQTAPPAPATPPRVLGRFGTPGSGPALVVTGGLHGNEPGGLQAAERVFAYLDAHQPRARGSFLVVRGNTRALSEKRRFLVKDLNRQFLPERVDEVNRADIDTLDPEDRELRDLVATVVEELEQARGDGYFLDLHTTSAVGIPFMLLGDTLRNRAFSSHFPLSVILGLEEQLDGTLLEYLNNLGYVTLGCEGGQHDLESSVDHHEAVLWIALVAAGILAEADVPDLARMRRLLDDARSSAPRVMEVRYRHAITPDDGFQMRPGFSTMQPVDSGQLLAWDARGEVRAKWDGWILMPLYQGQGNDGFFLARAVRPLWLGVSSLLRRLRLSPLLRLLPGVSRDKHREDSLIVDTRIARWFPLEVFHLFGYRKLRSYGPVLVVSRRRHDLRSPR